MKFVIRSLLFVNLLLQMTSSLKSCFDHDQNIMITIILLAFSVIGLIGLVISNRFILIIFSASMTLVLIASITIYAIGKTEEDSLRPKVPYYVETTRPAEQEAYERTLAGRPAGSLPAEADLKLKTLVDKWLHGKSAEQARNSNGLRPLNRSRPAGRASGSRLAAGQRKGLAGPLGAPTTPAPLDELSDEPAVSMQPEGLPEGAPAGNRAPLAGSKVAQPGSGERLREIARSAPNEPEPAEKMDGSGSEQVEDEQWVNYERHLYERYLNMVSQSIDLVLHTILAAWMALLLDEDSDQCFGPRSSSAGRRATLATAAGRSASNLARETPVYSYNGVRYSIRPDMEDSTPAQIVVH